MPPWRAIPNQEISVDAEENRRFRTRRRAPMRWRPWRRASSRNAQLSSKTADRFQVVVHVDVETLREGTAGRCEIEQGPSIPVQTVRRLSCDASVLRLLESEQGESLDVGRKTRSIPAAIRRALHTAMAAVVSRAALTNDMSMPTTSSIGPTAEKRNSRTSSPYAACITAWYMRVRSSSKPKPAAVGVSCTPTDGTLRSSAAPSRQHDWEDLGRTHAELGIHIDRDTAATRWQRRGMD